MRVVCMVAIISKEFLAAETHVGNTGDITRRLRSCQKAAWLPECAGSEALDRPAVCSIITAGQEQKLSEAAKTVKATPAEPWQKRDCEHLLAEVKALQSENESLKSKAAKEALGDVMDQVKEVKRRKASSGECAET